MAVGTRVQVPFGGRRRTGWVVGVSDRPSADPDRVLPLTAVASGPAWFDVDDLPLLRWVADRYAGTLGSVLRHAMPDPVGAVEREASTWAAPTPSTDQRRPACPSTAWRPYAASALLRAVASAGSRPPEAYWLRLLPGDDRDTMVGDLVVRCLGSGRSALVLAPDPAATLPDAALAAAGAGCGADWRPDSRRERYRAFLRGRTGSARVAVGERSAVFAPLRDLGLVVVDDEANPAWKERRSPRHHVREVALARARMAGATCVLLGDLPSAGLWRLLQAGHVTAIEPDRSTERRRAPRVDVADLSDPRPGTRRTRLTDTASRALTGIVRDGGAAVVLASRGGQGGALACRRCRRRRTCPVCDGSLSVQRTAPSGAPVDAAAGEPPGWRCAVCGWHGPPSSCPECASVEISPLSAGAGRLAAELGRSHPGAEVTRMEGFDAPGPRRRPAVAVMTRGSVVTRPGWLGDGPADVVVLPDADAMLGRPVLDAAEDALRLWFAAGRWARRIVVQTREPLHPAVQALVRWDAVGFWDREAPRRAELRYPPAASLISLRGPGGEAAEAVAAALRQALPGGDEVLGPGLDGGVLVKSDDLRGTLAALAPLRRAWDRADRKVRVDVDPV